MENIIVQDITIFIKRIRSKFLYIKISPNDRQIFVTAPCNISDEIIESIINSKLSWIKENQALQVLYNKEDKCIMSLYIHHIH